MPSFLKNFFETNYFKFYLIFIFIFSVLFLSQKFLYPTDWTTSEWMINYQSGFVRRGLSGELFFEYALNDYWSKQTNQIITFEKLMYDYGSPGKVFQLDEKSMEEYLEKLETDGKNFVFNRGAGGLRQINKVKEVSENQLLKNCYKKVA